MSKFYELQQQRRSIYALGENVSASKEELVELIQSVIKESPSSFNVQSSRAVILFGEESDAFWQEIAHDALKEVTPEDQFESTKEKLDSFSAGIGTVLFFEDKDDVKGLQEQFPLYADNFPIWSEHSHGIAAYSVWTALAEQGIGASLQHYNPLVDEALAKKYDLPDSWKLRAQMPFGSIEGEPGEKEYMDDDKRFKVFGNK